MIVFDLETQFLAAKVGGWGNKQAMRVAVACSWDAENEYQLWWEAQAADLIDALDRDDLIVGYNVNSFDFQVLGLYGDTSGFINKAFDIHEQIFKQTSRRVSLNVVANINLGEAKAQESGVVAVALWRTGRLEELAAYCQKDVELTRRLFEFWRDNGILWISETEYAVWPGVDNLEDGEE